MAVKDLEVMKISTLAKIVESLLSASSWQTKLHSQFIFHHVSTLDWLTPVIKPTETPVQYTSHFGDNLFGQSLDRAFSTNHLADTNNTKHNTTVKNNIKNLKNSHREKVLTYTQTNINET